MKRWLALVLAAILVAVALVGCGQDDSADTEEERPDVKVVGSQEFFDRADAMPAFEEAYGFELADEQKIALATGDTAVTEKAAAEGTDGANAAMAYGTDGTIAALDLVVLGDPKGVQPIYQPAPIFRKAIIDEYPQIPMLLEPAFAMLDLQVLQSLNAKVAIEGTDPGAVAQEWLESEGFLPGAGGDAKGPIVVGSKIDIEGPVLGEIMIKLLEGDGFEVTDKTRTGATDVVRKALLAGEIDAYPEYTANAITVFYADEAIDPAVLKDATMTYEEAARLDLEKAEIVWLAPAPANNTWAVAVPREFSEKYDVKTLQDWADYINGK
ncbi:MAG: hypothetical protein OEV43_03880 [Coriobacteriia bacterium]|nr:hypothetical protein [Coriobacteriia bacterium]